MHVSFSLSRDSGHAFDDAHTVTVSMGGRGGTGAESASVKKFGFLCPGSFRADFLQKVPAFIFFE